MSIENEILMYFRNIRKTQNDISMSEVIGTDKNGNSLTLIDTICVEDKELMSVINRDCYKMLERNLEKKLTKREREIIILRYGLYGLNPLTQKEIAKKYNICRSYVSRIEKKALEKLKEDLEF